MLQNAPFQFLFFFKVQGSIFRGLGSPWTRYFFSYNFGKSHYQACLLVLVGHNLLCDAHAVSDQLRATAALFLFYSLSSLSCFSFCVFVTLDSLFLFLSASLVCFNNLKRTADGVVIPRQDICLLTPLAPQRLNDLNMSIAIKALH